MRPLRRKGETTAASGVGSFNVVVAAVVLHNASILLLQRSSEERFLPSVWGLPCGKIRFGEKLQDAVLRELKEEASIDGNVERFAGSTWFTSEDARRRIENLQVNFVVRADSTDVNLDKSNQNFMWLPIKDLDQAPINLDAFTRKAITEAIKVAVESPTAGPGAPS